MKFLTFLVFLYSLSCFSVEKVLHTEIITNDEWSEIVTKVEKLVFSDESVTYVKTQINYQGELVSIDVSKTPYQD
jgi:hypothetical protein